MRVHPFARGVWDHEPSLTLGCTKRLRPLAPNLAAPSDDEAFGLRSFIRPDGGPKKEERRSDSPQVETHPGGTRWNPTQEQIGILEMLYRGGMRTPNAPQIEQITAQLGKYGKIEGKNVFYWFQNHKARERQKQKRTGLGLGGAGSPRTPSPPLAAAVRLVIRGGSGDAGRVEDSASKRKCRGWGCPAAEDGGEEGDRTLELFPLHPDCRIR